MVQINTMLEPGSDAAVVRVKHTHKALALSTDCNGRYCYLDPYEGTRAAVAEAARNIVCSGGKPIAITNCLNFGNPYKPEVYWTFAECIRGMGDACRELGTPVTGGNVSFYNENPGGAIYPTPVIGMLGILEDYNLKISSFFQTEGDIVILLGDDCDRLDASQYLSLIHHQIMGHTPSIDMATERLHHSIIYALNRERLVRSAHDCSEGGLAVCLTECCFGNPDSLMGVKVDCECAGRRDAVYFGETQGRIVISVAPEHLGQALSIIQEHGARYIVLGKTGGQQFQINRDINLPVAEVYKAWSTGLML